MKGIVTLFAGLVWTGICRVWGRRVHDSSKRLWSRPAELVSATMSHEVGEAVRSDLQTSAARSGKALATTLLASDEFDAFAFPVLHRGSALQVAAVPSGRKSLPTAKLPARWSFWRPFGVTTSEKASVVPASSHRCSAPLADVAAEFSAALLFDCDGVLVETEELHRVAYNKAFAEFELEIGGKPVEWSKDYYAHLAGTVGGGKPKMRYHFTGLGAPAEAATHPDTARVWPTVKLRGGIVPKSEAEGMALVDDLQAFKTECYKQLVQTAKPRPGILELMDSAIATPGLAVGICSASTRAGFEKVTDAVVGEERLAKLDLVIAGDDVNNKKPDPEIYNVAAERLGLSNVQCVVVEDSMTGLRAAKAAGMKCIITYTEETASSDFYGAGADAKLLDLSSGVKASDIFVDGPAVADELLPSIRDPK